MKINICFHLKQHVTTVLSKMCGLTKSQKDIHHQFFLCDFQHVAIFKPAGFGKMAMMTCTPFEMWNYIFFEALLARPAPVSLPNILSSCRKFDDRSFFRIEESPATKPSGKLLESSKKVSFSKNKHLKFAVLQHFAWTFGSLFCCSRSQPPSHIFSSTAWKCFFRPKLKPRKDHPESSLLNLFLLVWLYLII